MRPPPNYYRRLKQRPPPPANAPPSAHPNTQPSILPPRSLTPKQPPRKEAAPHNDPPPQITPPPLPAGSRLPAAVLGGAVGQPKSHCFWGWGGGGKGRHRGDMGPCPPPLPPAHLTVPPPSPYLSSLLPWSSFSSPCGITGGGFGVGGTGGQAIRPPPKKKPPLTSDPVCPFRRCRLCSLGSASGGQGNIRTTPPPK